ncbi:MAG: nucleotide exchange factor GrpE [Clostridiales bacterium]|jgi:molecular chaperone GrpE (heat shock protein)|nr:nucleotide exchange factor GrpE [Clostridiales bacterium]
MAFNWFFAIGKGWKPVFRKRAKPTQQLVRLLPALPEREEIKKSAQELGELKTQVKKLGARNKEMVMAVEELTEGLREQREITADEAGNKDREINSLVSAMIAAADYTEDFYNYAKEYGSNEIYEQARFFWNSLNKKFSAAGLVRIHDENTLADATFNHISAAEYSGEVSKPGVIIRTLRSGYLYKGKVVRRSEVVASKTEGD